MAIFDFSILRLMFHEFGLFCCPFEVLSLLTGRFRRTHPLNAPKGLPHLSILINANVRLAFSANPWYRTLAKPQMRLSVRNGCSTSARV